MSPQSNLSEPQLNATPLIDVMLVLLVMLIMTVPIATHAVKLNLPYGKGKPPPAIVYLDVSYNGEIFLNGEFVPSIDALTPKLVALARRADAPPLQVTPERRAPYERVAQVLAAAQRSHVAKLSVTPVPDT
jgi:biopolymer transport protein ExbD